MTNPYRALRQKLELDLPPQVGTVLSVEGGIATLELPSGGITSARGDATVGEKVFFRNGAIEGTAPDLPDVIIEV
jgi:hypothetical protein